MDPRIQYAKTADGVSIAFRTVGEGEPAVWMPKRLAIAAVLSISTAFLTSGCL